MNSTETNGASPNAATHRRASAESAMPFILAAIVALVAVGATTWVWIQKNQPSPTIRAVETREIGPPPQVTDFELTERSGEPFRSAEMLGEVWVVTFFFTTCPGPCERLNRNIEAIQSDPALAGVKWVSITVDPDNDTLDVLNRYAERFSFEPGKWLFCRGTMEFTERLGQEAFKLPVGFKGHNEYGVVIDRTGAIRDWIDVNSRRERMKLRDLLIECLKEEPPSDSPASGDADSVGSDGDAEETAIE